MAVRVLAASELIETHPAERAMRGVPPDEVGNCGGGCQDQADRNQKQQESTSHGQAKYSTRSTRARTRIYVRGGRRRASPTAKTSRPRYVPHTGQA